MVRYLALISSLSMYVLEVRGQIIDTNTYTLQTIEGTEFELNRILPVNTEKGLVYSFNGLSLIKIDEGKFIASVKIDKFDEAGEFLTSTGLLLGFSIGSEILWTKEYPEYTTINALTMSSNSELFLTGFVNPAHRSKLYVAKATQDGAITWSTILEDYDTSRGIDITNTTDGSTIVVGSGSDWNDCGGNHFHSCASNNVDIGTDRLFVKVDSKGSFVWSILERLAGEQVNTSMVNDTKGGFWITGIADLYFTRFGNHNSPRYTYLDSNGNALFDDIIYDIEISFGHRPVIIEATDGNYIGSGTSETGIFIRKFNETGQNLWLKEYKIGTKRQLSDIIATADGGYLLTGSITIDPLRGSDLFLLKADSKGDSCWSRIIGGVGDEIINSVVSIGSIGYLVLGSTSNGFRKGLTGSYYDTSDLLLIMIDKEGQHIKEALTDNLHNTNINFSSFIEDSINNPRDIQISQNYPNPFNYSTSVEIFIPQRKQISLEIFSIDGKKVQTLIEGSLSSGHHKIPIYGEHLSSGIYILCLKQGDQLTTRKMIHLK